MPLVESKESSPVDEEEIKLKMDDGIDTSLSSEGIELFVELGGGGGPALSLGPKNNIVVS